MYQKCRPGKVWYDTEGKPIQAHGGSILYAEGKFWWYGEDKTGITGTGTGEKCPFWHNGVRLYSSTDLYNWKDEGHAMRKSEDKKNPFYPAHIMDRPHILYNEKTKRYALWAKTSRGDFNGCGFSVCVGEDLHNFRFVKEIIPTPFHGGDFDLFVEDGAAYVVYENPHTELVCQRLTEDYLDVTEEYSSHLPAEGPPFTREAPAFFRRAGRRFLLTSGTTGYYPNPSQIAEMMDIHGEWRNLGDPCVDDKQRNSFHAQFSSVFQHPFKEDLYIALGDRWLTDLPVDMPNMEKMFYELCSPKEEPKEILRELRALSTENTSEARYVWLPIRFTEKGTPYIEWLREWAIED